MDTPTVMQRQNEAGRIVLDGRRTDDDAQCSLVVVRELSGTSAIYPHGADKLGVRLSTTEAVRMARAILADAE
ncbi:MAG: hypothetical protein ACRDTC_04885 [Pseudonocardiaceae bacterium]